MHSLQNYAHYHNFCITSPCEYVVQVSVNRIALSSPFRRQLVLDFGSLFRQISVDPDFRAVVLTAEDFSGSTSCVNQVESDESGIHDANMALDPARQSRGIRRCISMLQEHVLEIEKCTKPVICALSSDSYGIALDLACCCDIRICSADTRFAIKEIDGGTAADLGTLTRLPKVARSLSWAKYVCLTGAEFDAKEAFVNGLVSKVLPDSRACLEEAQRIARAIGSKSPVAAVSTKAIMNFSADRSVQQGLDFTASWNAFALQTEDVQNCMESFHTSTKPTFAKLSMILDN